MRISQLAAAAGVSVATVKFYLRERLLPEGRLTSATQAQYDDAHVQRLRLIRALLGAGGLSIAATRDVLHHLDHPPASGHDLLGVAQDAVTPPAPPELDLGRVDDLLAQWGWRIEDAGGRSRALLERALAALDAAGFVLPPGALDVYARTTREMAAFELDHVPTSSQADAVRYVVLGTVLIEPVLLAIRRLAEQDASAERFSGPTARPGGSRDAAAR